MAVPSSRHRAGKIEIDNKERVVRDELKKRQESEEKEEITPEEHEERIKMLKSLGLLK